MTPKGSTASAATNGAPDMSLRRTILLQIVVLCVSHSLAAKGIAENANVLSKDTAHGSVPGVYIEPDRNSPLYQELTGFQLDNFRALSYRNSMDGLRQRGLKPERSRIILPWRQWVSLERYKGGFYVYKPCDFFSHYGWSINDTTVIDWTGEGAFATMVLSQKKLDANTYQVRYTGAPNQSAELIIHLVDRARGIAIFRYPSGTKDTTYRLMIAALKIRSVPLIVNHCPTGKRGEFSFEEPDWKALNEFGSSPRP